MDYGIYALVYIALMLEKMKSERITFVRHKTLMTGDGEFQPFDWGNDVMIN